ncbi:hypothetical protein SAMN06265365_108115 [Tistlia consotensis]|uniref:PAS domain-containing protein n=1 Tax=Tistlia consotensis USBA 355 TaxID=560819 RepID=A0A1Y6BS07_9PROT|nr:PAS domain-containing protein [Tistlia consotensis]SMF24108.1 hypothetical protein SAMN05428998_10865 [Tistlia consotensis USBA 355]SNR60925.1 hypothetical protein SAMN06265365_108115 [Tistlia consotensis]
MIQTPPSPGAPSIPDPLEPDAFRDLLGDGRLGQLYDYWESKRPPGGLPARKAIEPSELTRLLPWIYLLEPVEGDVKVRLAGTRIRELFDRELTGQGLVGALPTPWSDNAARSYATVVGQKRGWLTVVESRLHDGRILPYRRLSLPLSSDGVVVDRVLGGVDWDEWLVGSRNFFEVYDEAVSRKRREACCRFL